MKGNKGLHWRANTLQHLRKMKRKNLTIEQMYDLLALRVITNSVVDCYQVWALSIPYEAIPGQFDDYIANPKATCINLCIPQCGTKRRTWKYKSDQDMHWIAEYGIAAHWRYKEGQINRRPGYQVDVDKTSLERSSILRSSEFLENLKQMCFIDRGLRLYPKGDVISLPKGATPGLRL